MTQIAVGDVDIKHIGHATFLFGAKGHRILCDPYFTDRFPWGDHEEHRLTPPRVPEPEVPRPDVIFVSHAHGDHFDPAATARLSGEHTLLIAPFEVLCILESAAPDTSGRQRIVTGDDSVDLGGIRLYNFCGYDNGTDGRGRVNKTSLLIETPRSRIFYSGDCHEVPPGLKKFAGELDLVVLWPADHAVERFVNEVGMQRMMLMHGDAHEPGDFLCSLDYQAERDRLTTRFPSLEVLIPV